MSGARKLVVRRPNGIWTLTATAVLGGVPGKVGSVGPTARIGTFLFSDGGLMSSSIVTEIPARVYGKGSDVADTRDVSLAPMPFTNTVTNCPGATLIG